MENIANLLGVEINVTFLMEKFVYAAPENKNAGISLGVFVNLYIFTFLSLRLLLTTETELNAIANAASMGLINPNAAAGIRMTL